MDDFCIAEELKKLPANPGVYLMHDRSDTIIYVGKAKVLKNRVRQYFQSPDRLSPKIRSMVSHIKWFEYIVVDSELEALILECNLIKEHRPKYNTMLKDDKTYPYIAVTVQEDFPRVLLTRQPKKDGARYFGPYTNGVNVGETIEMVRRLFGIRVCNKSVPDRDPSARPCLYHRIHQCDAPCVGSIGKEEYALHVEEVLRFLGGDYRKVLASLEEKMLAASSEMRFEEAARYRDLMNQVKALSQKQKAHDTSQAERDIIAFAGKDDSCVIQVFFEREGQLLGREHFHMTGVSDKEPSQLLGDFIKQYYSGTGHVPKELLLETEPEEAELIAEWLGTRRGGRVQLTVPKIGGKEKLLLLAKQNAEMVLSRDLDKLRREEERTKGAVEELRSLLNIPCADRMESYDISNTSGFFNVGSMVVFERGQAKKSDYRKFRIKSFSGPDDYASMEEVLTRRFTHGIEDRKNDAESSFTRFPDLILMDGGKGQVNICERVLRELGLCIPVCGMVKDDRHRTRGLYFHDVELPIDTHSAGFHLITRIQDETHRFAITYHKSLRGRAETHSVLDDIPGIGPARRLALMKRYTGLAELKEATVEELLELPEMNRRAASQVYEFFHRELPAEQTSGKPEEDGER